MPCPCLTTIPRLLVLCLVLPSPLAAQDEDADRILGVWVPGHGDARVQIEKSGDAYQGTIVWLRTPDDPETGAARTDRMNPDASLRARPLLGLRIVQDFRYAGDGEWTQGIVYDPAKGKRYCGRITFIDDDQLRLRGSLCAFSLLGRNDTWTRHDDDSPD